MIFLNIFNLPMNFHKNLIICNTKHFSFSAIFQKIKIDICILSHNVGITKISINLVLVKSCLYVFSKYVY